MIGPPLRPGVLRLAVSVVDLLRPGIHGGHGLLDGRGHSNGFSQRRVGEPPVIVDVKRGRPVARGTAQLAGFLGTVVEDVDASGLQCGGRILGVGPGTGTVLPLAL